MRNENGFKNFMMYLIAAYIGWALARYVGIAIVIGWYLINRRKS